MIGEQERYVIKNGVFYTSEVCEINVVDHCNFSCRSCRHLSPVCKPSCVDPQQVYEEFSNLSQFYRSRTLKVLGGEPLLHPNIDDVLSALRDSQISDSLIVSTNGPCTTPSSISLRLRASVCSRIARTGSPSLPATNTPLTNFCPRFCQAFWYFKSPGI